MKQTEYYINIYNEPRCGFVSELEDTRDDAIRSLCAYIRKEIDDRYVHTLYFNNNHISILGHYFFNEAQQIVDSEELTLNAMEN